MKNCNCCGSKKHLDRFYKHPNTKDGLFNICKDCHINKVKENYQLKRGEKIEQWHQLYKDPEFRAKRAKRKAKYQKSDKGRAVINKYMSTYNVDPLKHSARCKVYYALTTGKIKRMACEVCGSMKSEAHHDDYSKALDVNWLCRKHHRDLHTAQSQKAKQEPITNVI